MVITKLDVTYSVAEAVEYFNIVSSENFDHLKWSMKNDPNSDLTILNVYGWAAQYPNTQPSGKPHALYTEWNILGREFYRDSEIAFGFIKKILNAFPLAFRACIYVSPPGTYFKPHCDDPGVFRIHIPVQSNPDATWVTADGKTNMVPGNAYLLDAALLHETFNTGSSNRVHIELEMRREDVHTLDNISICI